MPLDACTLTPRTWQPAPGVSFMNPHYLDPVPVPADLIAAALREHLPGVAGPKLHRLLYYIQGHHLALFGQPAFNEPIRTGPHGPEVAGADAGRPHTRGAVDQATLNTVLIVATRYGQLSTGDLDRLTRTETPWRGTPAAAEIGHAQLREWFAGPCRPDEPAHPLLHGRDPARRARVLEEVTRIRTGQRPPSPDNLDDFAREVAGHGR